jgi:hypothetical protein
MMRWAVDVSSTDSRSLFSDVVQITAASAKEETKPRNAKK